MTRVKALHTLFLHVKTRSPLILSIFLVLICFAVTKRITRCFERFHVVAGAWFIKSVDY